MTRDEFLTKAMGKCWHEWERVKVPAVHPFGSANEVRCKHCGIEYERKLGESKLDFITLLLWSQDDNRTYVPQGGPEKWTWAEFLQYAYRKNQGGKDYSALWSDFIRWLFNPERFAGILAEFLGWREL